MVTKWVLARRHNAEVPGMSQADPNDPCLDWLQVCTQCVCVCARMYAYVCTYMCSTPKSASEKNDPKWSVASYSIAFKPSPGTSHSLHCPSQTWPALQLPRIWGEDF